MGQSAASVHATGIPLCFEARNCVLVPRMSCSVFFPVCVIDHSIFALSSTTRTSRNTPSAAGHGDAPPRNPFVACARLYPCSVALRKEGREEGSISPKFAGCQLSSVRATVGSPVSPRPLQRTKTRQRWSHTVVKARLLGSPIGAGETLPK